MAKPTKSGLTAQLIEKGIWQEHFTIFIDTLFDNLAMMNACRKSIKDDGIFIKTKEGMKKNPAVDLYASCLREHRQYCSRLSLTPIDAKKIGIDSGNDDGFED